MREKALQTQLVAVDLSRDPLIVTNLAKHYQCLGRLAEAKAVLETAISEGIEGAGMHRALYEIAFLEEDAEAMKRHASWLDEHPGGPGLFVIRINEAAYHGRFQQSQQYLEGLAAVLLQRGRGEPVATMLGYQAYSEALVGNRKQALRLADRALGMEQANSVARRVGSWVLATAGEFERARQVADALTQELPESTTWNHRGASGLQAVIELGQGSPEDALRLLRSVGEPDLMTEAGAACVLMKGRTLLALGRGEEAGAVFQMILDNHFVNPFSLFVPLSQVGLARAKVLMGDEAAARKLYQDFLALWKDADADIPILREAKAEYAKLLQS
jgi:tetratricopeptide (TPR) repeat protein